MGFSPFGLGDRSRHKTIRSGEVGLASKEEVLTGLIALAGVVFWGLAYWAFKQPRKPGKRGNKPVNSQRMVSNGEIQRMVRRLGRDLKSPDKVPVTPCSAGRPHIWKAPNGREVYLN